MKLSTTMSKGLVHVRTSLRRTTESLMASYIHPSGRVGVLVEVNCETRPCAQSAELALYAQWIAEQIAATNPLAVERDGLAADLVARRHRAFVADAMVASATDDEASAAVERKMTAFYRDVVLMEQPWTRDPGTTIAGLTSRVAALSGECVRVRRFSRFHAGLA